ncbi:MAG TPA: hypothetical protein DDY14_09270 [Chromatiaceae bacterium]|jgi:hypothetical protein|nr:MAG: hypothetical protein N838_07695 [Thiohalocapsa sp. PB-PSB1]QQO53189.1 MAG: hypothetical protein N838_07255 [Thiohalocapsa sp. PB-PSB1]HBG95493.1 hypothetical protein [Chromatiaceae bacterium]HCS91270.1 hypothetical protein [Chromatiaceae bacterium]
MSAIKILMTDQTHKRWRTLEEQLSNDPGFKFVGRSSRLIELLLEVRLTEADAVVLFAETNERGILSHLFAEYPDLTVLTLCPTGEAFIDECCPTRRTVIDSSAIGIVKALRDAIAQPCDSANQQRSALN